MRNLIFAGVIALAMIVVFRYLNVVESFSKNQQETARYVNAVYKMSTTEIEGKRFLIVSNSFFKEEDYIDPEKIQLICGKSSQRVELKAKGQNHTVFPFPDYCFDSNPSFVITTKEGKEVELGSLPGSLTYDFGITDVRIPNDQFQKTHNSTTLGEWRFKDWW